MTYKLPAHIKASPIYSPIYNRIWTGGNWNWIVDGMPRTGKSTSCISIGKDLDVTPKGDYRFDIDFSICMSYKVLEKRINEIGYKPKDRGRVLIWEEASGFEGANSREFASSINIKLAKVCQIIGIKGILLLINLPSMFDLDKQIRKLCHSKMTMHRFNSETKSSIGSFKFLEPHMYKNEIFESYSIGQRRTYLNYVKTLEIPFAPKELYKRYTEIEKFYKSKWFEESSSSNTKVAEAKPIIARPISKRQQVINYLEHRIDDYINDVTNKIEYPRLMADLYSSGINVDRSIVSAAATSLNNKIRSKVLA